MDLITLRAGGAGLLLAPAAARIAGRLIPWPSFPRAVASAYPNGKFRSPAEGERPAGAGTTIPSRRSPTFAHVGKIARWHRAETTNATWFERASAHSGGWSAGSGSASGQLAWMGRDPRAGPDPCRLALSGLWRAAALGRAPCCQALPRRFRLRPGWVGCAVPLVPRPDWRALWAGAARGDRLGRRPVYVRGRLAGGAWYSPDTGVCPHGQKFSPSTMRR